MLKKILIGLAVIIAGIFGYAAIQPSEFNFERSITINASKEKIFPFINNHHKANDWNPWLSLDPKIKVDYDPPHEGLGAVTRWVGNKDVGTGKATITETRPNEYVQVRLDFLEPFESTSIAEYILEPEGEQTKVTWKFSGKNNIIGRVFCMFMDMDKMMTENFDRGLNKLKSMMEQQ